MTSKKTQGQAVELETCFSYFFNAIVSSKQRPIKL